MLVIRSMLFDHVFWGDFFLGGSWVAYFLLYFHDPSLPVLYLMDDLW
jgi:hypothetical protein